MKKISYFLLYTLTIFFGFNTAFAQVKKTREATPPPSKKLLLHKMDPNNLNFGLGLDANFNLLGAQYGNYSGRTMPRISFFLTRPINKYYVNSFVSLWDYAIEPVALNIIGSRERNIDNQYGGYYYDPSFALHLIPDRSSSDFRIILGVRPSFLLYSYTEILENGEYRLAQGGVDANKNKAGDFDLSGMLGFSFKFSSIGNFEIKYVHSFTNQNNINYVKGRPDLVELGIKLSAVQIGKVLFDENEETQKQLLKLSKGTLLVMLPTTNPNEEKALREMEKYSEIQQLHFQQEATNKMVVENFNKHYKFSKVLFFYDTSALKIVNKNFDGVFLNPQGEVMPRPESFDSTNFFIASFCDDVSEFSNKFTYGLHVYDDKMQALSKPFNVPRNDMGLFPDGDIIAYMRKKKALFNINEYEKVVQKFNDRLIEGKMKQLVDNE